MRFCWMLRPGCCCVWCFRLRHAGHASTPAKVAPPAKTTPPPTQAVPLADTTPSVGSAASTSRGKASANSIPDARCGWVKDGGRGWEWGIKDINGRVFPAPPPWSTPKHRVPPPPPTAPRPVTPPPLGHGRWVEAPFQGPFRPWGECEYSTEEDSSSDDTSSEDSSSEDDSSHSNGEGTRGAANSTGKRKRGRHAGHTLADWRGFVGARITYDKSRNKWQARLRVDGTLKHVDYYETEDDAALDFPAAIKDYAAFKEAQKQKKAQKKAKTTKP